MLNTEKINEISNKINEMIKSTPLTDVEKNINALIRGAFTKMELVSREEFDVQAEVLWNTREMLHLLEAKLAAIEAQLKQK
jgi:BMFP domain-containing protein YqiC